MIGHRVELVAQKPHVLALHWRDERFNKGIGHLVAQLIGRLLDGMHLIELSVNLAGVK